jgi:hypothetical protein
MSDEWICIDSFETIDDAEWAKSILIEAGLPAAIQIIPGEKRVELKTRPDAVTDAEAALTAADNAMPVNSDEDEFNDGDPIDDDAGERITAKEIRKPGTRPTLQPPATDLSIRDLLGEPGQLIIPDWDRVGERIALARPDDPTAAWADVTREWLAHTADCLGPSFGVVESKHVQLLAPFDDHYAYGLLANAEDQRRVILNLIAGVTRFSQPGKIVVLCLKDYYSYVSAFYPDQGEFAGSGGMFIKDGHPHVVLPMNSDIVPGLAHEMTHASLMHLTLPAWLEEGITQYVQFGSSPNTQHVLTEDDIKGAKWFWQQTGLGSFWWGHGFHTPGRTQQYSYQLSDWLFRLLTDEHRPAWFGLFGTKNRKRFLDFIANANAEDAGAASAEKHLGYSLGTLAAKILGPGDWEPRSEDRVW